MSARTLRFTWPLKSLCICFALTVIDFLLVGLPGPCSFSGAFGDSLAHTPAGFGLAYALVVLPLLGTILSIVWIVVVGIVRLLPGSRNEASDD
jgi:hypothetical protein